MKWSWFLGRVGGIQIRLHATFLILLAWLAIVDYRSSGTVMGAAVGVLFTLALFGSVVLHELGHALAARRFGVATIDITLLPIGGIARLDHVPEKPRQELVIALAGPAVSLIIAVAVGAGLWLAGLPVLVIGDAAAHRTPAAFAAELVWANLVLLGFNMLPAFPMDGGRVLRAVLALRLNYAHATAVATRLARTFAVLFGAAGLLYSPFLVVIALFIWLSAAAESAELLHRSVLSGVRVERLMIRDVQTLAADDSLNVALRATLTGFQQDFPVLAGDRVAGVLTRVTLLEGLAQRGAGSPVAASMDTTFRTAGPGELVLDVLARLPDHGCRSVPILAGEHLVGLLTPDNIAEFVLIESVLHSAAGPARSLRSNPRRKTDLTGALQ